MAICNTLGVEPSSSIKACPFFSVFGAASVVVLSVLVSKSSRPSNSKPVLVYAMRCSTKAATRSMVSRLAMTCCAPICFRYWAVLSRWNQNSRPFSEMSGAQIPSRGNGSIASILHWSGRSISTLLMNCSFIAILLETTGWPLT